VKTGSNDQANGVKTDNKCRAGSDSENCAERWLQENYAALESSNSYVERHGIPLSEYRRF
jgi:antitoxin CcdA